MKQLLSDFLNSGSAKQQAKKRLVAMILCATAVLLAIALVTLMIASIATALKNKAPTEPEENESDFSFERSSLGKRPIKPITDYDVEIVELPENFSRADLQRLEESKAAMRKDSDEYVSDVLSGKISTKPENTDDGEGSGDNADTEATDTENTTETGTTDADKNE